MSGAFLDSNVIVYAFSDDPKAERARALLGAATAIGVQTLNEFTNVSRRKLGRTWADIRADLEKLYLLFPLPVALNFRLHQDAVQLAERYQFQWWDAMMIAAALASGSDVLWSEDMHNDLIVDKRLKIVNPFE